MLQASARLLRLLSLLQARATWAGSDLADRLDVTPRTLRRDVDRLRSLGYPVESTTGTAGGYMLGAGASLPPLSLDEDEATAVFVGLHAAAGTGVMGAGTASMRALSKLERVLPPRLKKNLAAFRGSVVEIAGKTPAISLVNVSELARACSERLVTRLVYRARTGEGSERHVEPLRLVRVDTLWYLVAWDPGKQAWRTFRLDRIQRLSIAGDAFKARSPPHDDLVRYVTESLSAAAYPVRGSVILHAPIERVRERVGPRDGVLRAISAQRCGYELGAPSLDVLTVMVLRLAVDFEVVEPEALAAHVAALSARLSLAARARSPRAR